MQLIAAIAMLWTLAHPLAPKASPFDASAPLPNPFVQFTKPNPFVDDVPPRLIIRSL